MRVALVSLKPLAHVRDLDPPSDGVHYDVRLPDGDRVHAAQVGWASEKWAILEVKVTDKGAGEPVGNTLTKRGKKLLWKIERKK